MNNNAIKNRIEQINIGQVPEGYKKTSFGIFPLDWEKRELKHLGIFSKGKGLTNKDLVDKGFSCVVYGDIYVKYDIHFSKAKSFIPKDKISQAGITKKGSLLFAGTGETALEIGKCICYTGEEVMYIGGDIIIFKPTNIEPMFLAYQQNTDFLTKQKAKLGQGHSIVHIYIRDLEKLKVVFPKSKIEQQKIAGILGEWDKAIEIQEKLIEKLEERKKGLMQKLLTPKENWSKKLLSEHIQFCTGKTTINNQYSIYTSSRQGIVLQSDYFNKSVASENNIGYKIIQKDEFTYRSMSDDKLFVFNLFKNTSVGMISPAYSVFKITNGNTQFFYYFLNSMYLKRKIEKIVQGGTRYALKESQLVKFVIAVPNFKEQTNIATSLTCADKEIDLHQQKLNKMKEQKKALMQLLLTGIVRVKV